MSLSSLANPRMPASASYTVGAVRQRQDRVRSLLGMGHNGHLVLVMTNAENLVISAVPYNEPIHPRAQPVHQAKATTV